MREEDSERLRSIRAALADALESRKVAALQLAVARGRDVEDTLPKGDAELEDLVGQNRQGSLSSLRTLAKCCQILSKMRC